MDGFEVFHRWMGIGYFTVLIDFYTDLRCTWLVDFGVQPGRAEAGLAALCPRQDTDEAGGALPGAPLSRVEVVTKGSILILIVEAVYVHQPVRSEGKK